MRLIKSLYNRWTTPDTLFAEELFQASPMPTIIFDDEETILMINKAFSRLSGYAATELIGMKMSLFKTFRQEILYCQERWKRLMASGYIEDEVYRQGKDRTERLWLERIQRIDHEGVSYYQCMVEDVTESRKQAARFRHLAMHDVLTGLANRSLAKDRFKHALLNTVRAGEKLGILLCDLNEFKQVNDHYGHHVGDALLVEISKRLSALVRKGDTVARVGGDEFLVIVERLQKEDELMDLVKKINHKMKIPFYIEGEKIDIRISIGDACSPQDGLMYEDLLKIADHKMYREKERYYGME